MLPAIDSRLANLDLAFGRLRRLWESPVLRRRFTQGMGVEVDPSVVRTLRAVREVGSEGAICEVAEWLSIDASTASRMIDAAVSDGYLERRRSSQDRRRSVVTLTPTGTDILDRALRVRQELLADLTKDLTDREVTKLADLLAHLADRVVDLENRS